MTNLSNGKKIAIFAVIAVGVFALVFGGAGGGGVVGSGDMFHP